jgi:hypothetical protein
MRYCCRARALRIQVSMPFAHMRPPIAQIN